MFLGQSNTNKLQYQLYQIYQENGGKSSKAKLYKLISLLQQKFVKENNLTNYIAIEADVVGFNDYVEALKTINADFKKMVFNYFSWNSYNPYKDDLLVGSAGDRRTIKSAEIQADDFGTLDTWREQFVQVLNRNFRDNNRIPVYRTSIHTRHYDRGNDGLQHDNPDHASLVNPVRGYDMSRIGDSAVNYKSEEWFGF
jgi:hypothetical protein